MMLKSQAGLLSPDELGRFCPAEAAHVIDPSRQILDLAGVGYTVRCRVGAAAGAIASKVVESQRDGLILGIALLFGPMAVCRGMPAWLRTRPYVAWMEPGNYS